MAAITRQDFDALMAKGSLDVLFEDALKNHPKQMDKLYRMETGEGAYHTELGLVGMGGPRLKAEMEPIKFDRPKQGRPITYIFNTWALGVALSRESRDDDRYKKIVGMVMPELARVFNVEREMQAADLFNFAFTVRGYEPEKNPARPLVSTDHKLIRPNYGFSSISNKVTGALSVTSLASLRVLARKNRNESGKLDPLTVKRIWVGPSNETLMDEILRSSLKPGQFVGGTQPNDLNVFGPNGTYRLDGMVYDWMTDDGRWFADCGNSTHKRKWFDREKLNTDTDYDKQARAYLYMAFARWTYGFSDWRETFGSEGS